MTDSDIMQALLSHEQWGIDACDSCPLTPGKACGMQLAREALQLIKRQKTEIEALIAGQETLQKYIATARAEAIKEFAERLKACCGNNTDAPIIWVKGTIDNLVKEMTEETT